MPVETIIFTYVVSLLAAISALAVYFEMHRRRFGPAASADRIFRCEKCGLVYTDDADVERSRCAQCGRLNEPMNF